MRPLTYLLFLAVAMGLCACDETVAGGPDGGPTSTDGGAQRRDGGANAVRDGGFPLLPTTPVPEGEFTAVVALAWCQYLAHCDRLPEDQPTVPACVDYWIDRLGGYAQIAKDQGLSYDASCVDTLFREMEARQCGENLWWWYDDDFRCRCDAYTGTLAEGEACTLAGIDGFSECAQGLRCFGTCENTCHDRVAPGAACDPFGVDAGICIPPAGFCQDGICEGLPAVGEPCGGNVHCDGETAWCDQDGGICRANLPRGAPCDDSAQCDTRKCEDGVCVAQVPLSPF